MDLTSSSSSEESGVPIQGHLWRIEALAEYLVEVYRKENVVPNDAGAVVDRARGKRRVLLMMMTTMMMMTMMMITLLLLLMMMMMMCCCC